MYADCWLLNSTEIKSSNVVQQLFRCYKITKTLSGVILNPERSGLTSPEVSDGLIQDLLKAISLPLFTTLAKAVALVRCRIVVRHDRIGRLIEGKI
jgi:hypothetical protein